MSSHHIIRDEQEPALLIATDTPPIVLMESLLEWSPSVWVMQPYVEALEIFNFKIDGIIQLNKNKPLVMPDHQLPTLKTIQSDDEAGLTAFIKEISKKDYTGLNILSDSEQLEKTIIQLTKITLPFPVNIYADQVKVSFLLKNIYKKWLPKDSVLNLIKSLVEKTENLEETGNDKWKVKKDGLVIIKTITSPFIIREELN
jgi:thiamine pyrophosphokinase